MSYSLEDFNPKNKYSPSASAAKPSSLPLLLRRPILTVEFIADEALRDALYELGVYDLLSLSLRFREEQESLLPPPTTLDPGSHSPPTPVRDCLLSARGRGRVAGTTRSLLFNRRKDPPKRLREFFFRQLQQYLQPALFVRVFFHLSQTAGVFPYLPQVSDLLSLFPHFDKHEAKEILSVLIDPEEAEEAAMAVKDLPLKKIACSDLFHELLDEDLGLCFMVPELLSPVQISRLRAFLIKKNEEGQKSWVILYLRFIEGKVLQDCGNRLNLTRERIRQLEIKIISELRTLFQPQAELWLNYLLRGRKIYVRQADDSFFADPITDSFIYELGKSFFPHLYKKDYDLFFLREEDLDKTISFIRRALVPGTIYPLEKIDQLYRQFCGDEPLMLSLKSFHQLLRVLGIRKYEQYFAMERIALSAAFNLCLYLDFPTGLFINQDGMMKMDKAMSTRFGAEYGFDSVTGFDRFRGLVNREDGQIVIWGAQSERIHVDRIRIGEEAKERLLQEFPIWMDKQARADAHAIFNQFQHLLRGSNIDNPHRLYGYIKLFFDGDYHFKKFVIRPLHFAEKTSSELVEIFIDPVKGDSREELVAKLNIRESSLSSATLASSRIICNRNNYFRLIESYDLPHDFGRQLREKILTCMDGRDYLSVYLLYPRFQDEFERLRIYDEIELFHLAKCLLRDEFNFYRPLIQSRSLKEVLTVKQIVLDLLPDNEMATFADWRNEVVETLGTESFYLFFSKEMRARNLVFLHDRKIIRTKDIHLDEATADELMAAMRIHTRRQAVSHKDLQALIDEKKWQMTVFGQQIPLTPHAAAAVLHQSHSYIILGNASDANWLNEAFFIRSKEDDGVALDFYDCLIQRLFDDLAESAGTDGRKEAQAYTLSESAWKGKMREMGIVPGLNLPLAFREHPRVQEQANGLLIKRR